MADDGMFAPLAAENETAHSTTGAARSKPLPIVPVPADAPACDWRHPKHGAPVAMWPYHDREGRLIGYAARVEFVGDDGERVKNVLPIAWCRIDNAKCHYYAWRARGLPALRALYRLPDLIADPSAPVVVTEGEKKADAVLGLFPGHVGTTSMGGAGAAKHSDWTALAGRPVIVWPDHDEPGRRYADDVAALATAAGAASVAIVVVPPDWPEGWDIADPLPAGAAHDALAGLLQSASAWTPTAPSQPSGEVDDAAEIARLAALPPLAYEREREAAAKRLGCRAPILDRLVAGARNNSATTTGQGRALDLHGPEPWPELVNGATLLDELAAAVRRHVVLGEAEAVAVALWVVAVHAFGAWPIFPRLFVSSPEKGCGKSTLLDVLSRVVPMPLGASGITAAALFRVIEAARPTLLLDEADSYARDNEDLRGVLDAGHRRDGAVIRTVGEDHEPRQFSAWAPVALAAIGHLPGTIEDRSIKIGLRRRRPDEPVESLRLDRTDAREELARKAARWAVDHAAELAATDPAMPEGVVNRAADNWRPLLSVADLAGGIWPERARRAAIELTTEGDDQGSVRVALLADIRAAFAAKGVDRLSSDELATHLGTLDDRPWPEYRSGRPITKAQIARLLKELRVLSGSIRLPDGSTPKGYYLAAFRDAFARYLPAENATTPQPQDFRGSAPEIKTPQGNGCGVSELAETPSIPAACGAVADREPHPDDDEFQERAAIREYEGGYPRSEAERRARAGPTGGPDKSCLQ
jgi:putative DNA primase/helicase